MPELYDKLTADNLFFGFRYALERETTAHVDAIKLQKRDWRRFDAHTQEMVCREVRVAITRTWAGEGCRMPRDVIAALVLCGIFQ